MSESSLSLGYADFRAAIAYYLGYGRNSGIWTSNQEDDINHCLKRGLRQFYSPPILQGDSLPHRWSFMRPLTTLVTVSGTWEYTAPDNFGALDGNMTYESGTMSCPLRIVSEVAIRTMRQPEDLAGYPRCVAVVPIASDGGSGQRFKFQLFPNPDAVYTLTYAFFVLPSTLSDAKPYPLGGEQHGDTIMQSCLAAAELSISEGASEIHRLKFMERLAASVGFDRQLSTPDRFGYNGDRSGQRGQDQRPITYVTYEGQLYEGQ